MLAFLPVETLIRERQQEYYRALALADKQAEATPFIEFMLTALRDAIRESVRCDQVTDQVADQVTDQVASLLRAIGKEARGAQELMKVLGLSHRPTFRNNYLQPAFEAGWIERTQPDAPSSPTQRYRLTSSGRLKLKDLVGS